MNKIPLMLLLTLVVYGCSSSSDTPSNSTPEDNTQQNGSENPEAADPEQSARYRLTFTSTWSTETHPVNFPGNPHFSGLVGALHNEQVIFWQSGQIATDGIEVMAETGGKSTFTTEINTAIASGYAETLLSGGGISQSPGTVSIEFTATRAYPELTFVSMLAPSPDWFVGVHNLSLITEENQFLNSLTRDLILYDSGTDSGDDYQSTNSDTNPREPIAPLTVSSGALSFVDGKPIVGQFVLEKL